jgi:hypothetical protein
VALIGRIFVVLFAFLVASLFAAIAFQLAILMPFWSGSISPDVSDGFFRVLVGFSFFFISLFSLLPAILVIAVAEAFRLRSAVFYAAAGGALAFAYCYGFGFTGDHMDFPMAVLVQAFVASGIVAGLVYWLIAGRNAGRWSERPRERQNDIVRQQP